MRKLCKNAMNPAAWFCYFFNGAAVEGETLDADGRCRACAKSLPPYEEEPSWLRNDED